MSNEDETYNGWANRETWAFNLHWQNDEGLYRTVVEWVGEFVDGSPTHADSDARLGEHIVEQVQELWRDVEHMRDWSTPVFDIDRPAPEPPLRMWERETGSVWRVDRAEVGEAAREAFDTETEEA